MATETAIAALAFAAASDFTFQIGESRYEVTATLTLGTGLVQHTGGHSKEATTLAS